MSTNNSVEIRLADESDAEILSRIYFTIRRDEFPWQDNSTIAVEDFEASTKGEAVYTAVVNGEIAGFISIWEQDKFVHSLFVLKQFRGMGIGKALVAEAVSLVGTPLTLKCMKENKNSVGFYLSSGWKIEKEELCPEGPFYLMSYGG